jgi:hypothetical protein
MSILNSHFQSRRRSESESRPLVLQSQTGKPVVHFLFWQIFARISLASVCDEGCCSPLFYVAYFVCVLPFSTRHSLPRNACRSLHSWWVNKQRRKLDVHTKAFCGSSFTCFENRKTTGNAYFCIAISFSLSKVNISNICYM